MLDCETASVISTPPTPDATAAARIGAAAQDVAVALVNTPLGRSPSRYADGYFAGLCFALSALHDRPAEAIAAQLLGTRD
jgi:hypothetical protein